MRYGILYSIVAVMFIRAAVTHGGWYWGLTWPAASFGQVAIGYLYLGPGVFGKAANGQLSRWTQMLLLPYLLLIWGIWHVLRKIKRESPFDTIVENIVLGRRLLSHELPANISHVVDLTAEFSEPAAARARSYFSYPVLDGVAPPPAQLIAWVESVTKLTGTVFIHCAEGHGRSGLFAAAMILRRGLAQTPGEALKFIQQRRPLVRLSRSQHDVLVEIHRIGWTS